MIKILEKGDLQATEVGQNTVLWKGRQHGLIYNLSRPASVKDPRMTRMDLA